VLEDIELTGQVQKRGEAISKKAICLFCDIRSFTAISEKLPPKQLVSLLNIYFSELIPIIEKYEGTVDKLVGDMIAAFWNLPQDVLEAELKATKAAVEMQKTMIRKVVPLWAQAGVPRIGIGIGLYSGNVIAGNIGSSHLMNYTVVGDTVYNAELLESMARPGEIYISEEIRKITDGKILQHFKIENNIPYRGVKKPGAAYVLKPVDYPDY
jgi:adenylate cyclase